MTDNSAPEKNRVILPLALFIISAILLMALAWGAYLELRNVRRATVEASLQAVAKLKIGQLENWLEARQSDISFLGEGSHFAIQFENWLKSGGNDDAAFELIQSRMRFLAQNYGYDTFVLFDLDGKGRIHYQGGGNEPLDEHKNEVLEAIRANKQLLVDFHHNAGEPIRIGMVAPLKRLDGQVIGGLLMAMPAQNKLFPMLQQWPLPSRTGETVLARREGKEILFIATNKTEPMTVRIPTSNPDLPTARIERGEHGILHGARDYVGDPVLAYADRVPGTPWLLVVKQDQSEADLPLQDLARWLALATLLLLGGTGTAIWFWWRSEENRYRTRILEQNIANAVLTEQARAELLASEEKYRILADYSSDWEYWIGPDGQFRYVSSACESICGYTSNVFYADPGLMERILHPDELPRWQNHLKEVRDPRHEDHAPFSLRIKTRQGEERWIEHVCRGVFDDQGTYFGQRGTNRDITDRKLAEMAFQESEIRFKSLIDVVPVPMCLVNREGVLSYFNQRFIETFGYSHEDLPTINEWWQRAYPDPEYREWVLATWTTAVAQAQATGTDIQSVEYQVTTKRGAGLYVEISGITLGEDLLATFHDVTERHQIELDRAQYRERLEREVQQRTTELSRRTTELETANHDLENFSYSVSHDLRAPLRAIDGFIAMLLEDHAAQLDDEGRRMFGVVSDNARKMGHLIDDILAFSRAGRLELDPAPVDMHALAQEVWSGLVQSNEGRAIELQLDDLPAAQCDPRALRQVWQNLLGNAIKFTLGRNPAIVSISAAEDDGFIRYQVADNGVGFNSDYAGKLFVLFQRLHGMDEFEGTGVGLAIVKRFIQKHGGQVSGTGILGQGATFNFTLPKQPVASAV